MNIAELVLAQSELRAGATGFALLVSAYGLGLIAGSLYAGRDGGNVRRRYAAGLVTLATGMLATALAPGLGLALLTFAFTGAGNGLFSVSNRVMLHRAIPERIHGRAFGLVDSLDCLGLRPRRHRRRRPRDHPRRPRDLRHRRRRPRVRLGLHGPPTPHPPRAACSSKTANGDSPLSERRWA